MSVAGAGQDEGTPIQFPIDTSDSSEKEEDGGDTHGSSTRGVREAAVREAEPAAAAAEAHADADAQGSPGSPRRGNADGHAGPTTAQVPDILIQGAVQPPTELPGGIKVVAPSNFLRRPPPAKSLLQAGQGSHATKDGVEKQKGAMAGQPKELGIVDVDQIKALRSIRSFLKLRTSYDVLPISFRLIIFDNALTIKRSLSILTQNDIVSAPLWDSKTSTFAGLLTVSDYINVIQHYWQNPTKLDEIEHFTLESLRDIERMIGVRQIETVSIAPERPLYEACTMMVRSRARRIPLVDIDDETKRAMVVSVITQYRILKFVAVNVKDTLHLRKPLKELPNLGAYTDLATARMDTSVIEVIHLLVKKNISSVPILNDEEAVVNVFEAVDVIALIKGGNYDELNLTVGEALLKRSEEFAGIYTCSVYDRLDTIFDTIRKSRVHRLVIIDEKSRLQGILTLSDILEYILLEGAEDDGKTLEEVIMSKTAGGG